MDTDDDALRVRLDTAERGVQWCATPHYRVYGPGLTRTEVAARHGEYLRTEYARAGPGAYHYVRVVPLTLPPEPWPTTYTSPRLIYSRLGLGRSDGRGGGTRTTYAVP